MKCTFQNGDTSWIDMYAIALQDPIPILHYLRRKHLLGQQIFRSFVNCCSGEAPSHLARAFKANTSPHAAVYQFGVQVPCGLKQAARLDKENGDNKWQEAINKELQQLHDYQTFKVLKKGENAPAEYKRIPYHIVFAVKFDLRRKARLVAGGNRTDPGKEDIYSGVVGIESVRTGFLLGELNKLTCCAGDIGNAFLYGTTKEKVYLIAGPEFGPELEGTVLIVARSLYSLCTSAARFHETLGDSLKKLGYKPSHYDPDLWYIDKGHTL